MKGLLLIVWMVVSLLLVSSVIGLVLFLPGVNNTDYYIPISERRSTWSTIGIKLINNVIKDL